MAIEAEVNVAFLRSTTCHRHGHAEFSITFNPAIVPVNDDAMWVIDWLEQSVAQGERFDPGQTCQVGWLVNEIRLGENDCLSLWEPDMRQFPGGHFGVQVSH